MFVFLTFSLLLHVSLSTCLSFSLYLSLIYICLSHFLFASVCLSLLVSLFLSTCFSLSLCLSVCLYLYGFSLSLCMYVCLSHFLFASVYLSFNLFLFFSLPLSLSLSLSLLSPLINPLEPCFSNYLWCSSNLRNVLLRCGIRPYEWGNPKRLELTREGLLV